MLSKGETDRIVERIRKSLESWDPCAAIVELVVLLRRECDSQLPEDDAPLSSLECFGLAERCRCALEEHGGCQTVGQAREAARDGELLPNLGQCGMTELRIVLGVVDAFKAKSGKYVK